MHLTLEGKRGLIVGIANADSIAWGCARALRAAGAELAVTWLNDKARPHVEPLAQQLQASIQLPLDVEHPEQMEAVFAAIGAQWGQLDSCCIRLPLRPAPTCMAAWWTAPPAALPAPWTSPATPSCAWRIWPSR